MDGMKGGKGLGEEEGGKGTSEDVCIDRRDEEGESR